MAGNGEFKHINVNQKVVLANLKIMAFRRAERLLLKKETEGK